MSGTSRKRALPLSLAMLAVSLVTLSQGQFGSAIPALLMALLGGVVVVGGVLWAIHRAERAR